ncbi:MAG: glutaredoxin domain-containing protein [Arhodomonas sp.]|nr:glutaredoxin domain-containing protein [Arhodomonas sp.]
MQVEIFTGPGCGYCERAKHLLAEHGIDYSERDMSEPEVRTEFMERLPRERSIPQVFIDGTHIGGYEDLRIRLQGR